MGCFLFPAAGVGEPPRPAAFGLKRSAAGTAALPVVKKSGQTNLAPVPKRQGSADTYMCLWDDGRTLLDWDDDGGDESLASQIVFECFSRGIYYVTVEDYGYAAGGSYDIQCIKYGPGEPDGDYTVAKQLPSDRTALNRVLEYGGDQDWSYVDMTAGRGYSIWTSNLGPLPAGALSRGRAAAPGAEPAVVRDPPKASGVSPAALGGADTYMFLYRPDGKTEICHDDDGGSRYASKINYDCPTTGRYFVMVRPYGPAAENAGVYNIQCTQSRLSWAGGTGYESDGVSPDSGTAGSSFIFKVNYTNPAGTAPMTVKVTVFRNGVPLGSFDLSPVGTPNWTAGAFSKSIVLTEPDNTPTCSPPTRAASSPTLFP